MVSKLGVGHAFVLSGANQPSSNNHHTSLMFMVWWEVGLWLVPCSLHVPPSLVSVLVPWLVSVSSDFSYYGRICHVCCYPTKVMGAGSGGVQPFKGGHLGVLGLLIFGAV